jgi:rsbT co-antagonist protein RsbR
MSDNQIGFESYRLQFSERDVERRRRYVGLEEADIERVRTLRPLIARGADRYVELFFDHLSGFDEAAALTSKPDVLAEAKRLKHEHLLAIVEGSFGLNYIEQRLRLGLLYGRVGLEVPVFIGAFHHLLQAIGKDVTAAAEGGPAEAFQTYMSLSRVCFLDIGLISDILISERERTISQQQDAIRELSTPVLQVRDRLLILPIIGIIDSQRARQITDGLLRGIRTNRAKVVVMDITGVAAVDSKVANHFIQTATAVRLMGARAIITGLSAEVAQALVGLGVDLRALNTVGDLQGGLEEAERILGYKVVRANETPDSFKMPGSFKTPGSFETA